MCLPGWAQPERRRFWIESGYERIHPDVLDDEIQVLLIANDAVKALALPQPARLSARPNDGE